MSVIKKSLFVYVILLFLGSSTWADSSKQTYQVLGIGSPGMDLLLPVEESFLETIPGGKGGSQHIDQENFRKVVKHARGCSTVSGEPLKIATGGSCANTIKGLASLGSSCALFGKVGRDEMGRRFLDKMVSLHITPLLIATDTPTAQVICLITPDHQRTFRYFPGASAEFSEKDLFPELFRGIDLVHIEGYALYNGTIVEESAKLAKKYGAKVSFDLACYEVVERFKERILKLLPEYVDVVFANEDEVVALLGVGPQEGCQKLSEMCSVAVTLIGKKGCWVGSGDKIFHCPTLPVTVVDTTGAGDLFAAGFLHGYLNRRPLEECAFNGNVTGSTVVQIQGAEIPHSKWMTVHETIRTPGRLAIKATP